MHFIDCFFVLAITDELCRTPKFINIFAFVFVLSSSNIFDNSMLDIIVCRTRK